ncbi:MAG: ROK family protein [Candidatus Pacearchaeota archaeon]|nr:ROK family protein [Candidatus Pacearchaeota archaeon]
MRKVIAVDLGGTNLRASLVVNNKIVKYMKNKTPKNEKDLVDLLFKNIALLMDKDVKGIGVSCAGPLKDGIIKNPPNLPLKNYHLKAALEKRFKKKVELCNDAHCVALAESTLGVRKKNFIILTLGTGVGGGIIIDGKLYEGQGFGGEMGHMILDDGKDFESLVGWKNTRELTKKAFGKELIINDLIKINNKKSKEILDKLTLHLGQGIGSLINIFDPEIVVIAGGVRETGSAYLNMIKEQVKNYSVLPKTTPIQWSKLDHPGTLGASLLIK